MGRKVKSLFDKITFTVTYIVYDETTKDAIIIDPVLDYDSSSASVSSDSVDKILNFIKEENLNVHYLLETHPHADHFTGAAEIKKQLPNTKIAIGKNITKVQKIFSDLYNLKDFNTNGVQFDVLLDENDILEAGSIKLKTILTPGHTPACVSYLIDDMAFVGDALFMPDYGTGRCDFPSGNAKDLFYSIQEKLYSLPDKTRVFTGHDYQPGGRDFKCESTIGDNKLNNIQLRKDTTEKEFIDSRTKRDKTLATPRLLLPSLQVNIDAGNLPKAENNGSRYLKIPLTEK